MPRQAPAHVAHADPPSSTAAAAWFDDAPGTDTDGGGLWEYEGDVGFVDAPSSRANNDGYSNSGGGDGGGDGGGGGGAACASSGWASGETDTSDLVDRLVAMGFSHRDSERCLAECDGDIERAATVCQSMPMPSHKSSLDTRLMRHSDCFGDFHGLGHQPSPHRGFPSGISLVNASLHESPLVEADALHFLLNFDSHPTVLVALRQRTL